MVKCFLIWSNLLEPPLIKQMAHIFLKTSDSFENIVQQDRVGPVDNSPPTNYLHKLTEEKKIIFIFK